MTVTIPTAPTTRRNVALTTARTFAGLVGALQLAGVAYFTVLAPEEAVWIGLWIDLPVIGLLLSGIVLLLAFALAPGLDPHRRIGLGLIAVALGVAVTLVKIPVYDEPEGATFLVLDAVLLALLLLARRGAVAGRPTTA